jgi:hypothetical protein
VSTTAGTFKAALFTACQSLYDPATVTVSYGHPGTFQADDAVWLGNVKSVADLATMSPLRRREEVLELTGTIRSFSGGGPEVQQTVTERAYALLSTLDTYLDDSGVSGSTKLTLGGVVRWALIGSHELVEAVDPEVLAKGRVSTITFTVAARTRI